MKIKKHMMKKLAMFSDHREVIAYNCDTPDDILIGLTIVFKLKNT